MLTIPGSQTKHKQEINRERALAALFEHTYYKHLLDVMDEKEDMYINRIMNTPAEDSHTIARFKGKLEALKEIQNTVKDSHKKTDPIN